MEVNSLTATLSSALISFTFEIFWISKSRFLISEVFLKYPYKIASLQFLEHSATSARASSPSAKTRLTNPSISPSGILAYYKGDFIIYY
jgi:hypothetical protein